MENFMGLFGLKIGHQNIKRAEVGIKYIQIIWKKGYGY